MCLSGQRKIMMNRTKEFKIKFQNRVISLQANWILINSEPLKAKSLLKRLPEETKE